MTDLPYNPRAVINLTLQPEWLEFERFLRSEIDTLHVELEGVDSDTAMKELQGKIHAIRKIIQTNEKMKKILDTAK